MTKQFFFKISKYRKDHLHFYNNYEVVLETVKQIKEQLIPKKKNIINGFIKGLSFKKKRSDKKTKENENGYKNVLVNNKVDIDTIIKPNEEAEKLEVDNENKRTGDAKLKAEKTKKVTPINTVTEIENTTNTSKKETEDFNNQIIFTEQNSTKQMSFLEKEAFRKLLKEIRTEPNQVNGTVESGSSVIIGKHRQEDCGKHENPVNISAMLKNESICKEIEKVPNQGQDVEAKDSVKQTKANKKEFLNLHQTKCSVS